MLWLFNIDADKKQLPWNEHWKGVCNKLIEGRCFVNSL